MKRSAESTGDEENPPDKRRRVLRFSDDKEVFEFENIDGERGNIVADDVKNAGDVHVVMADLFGGHDDDEDEQPCWSWPDTAATTSAAADDDEDHQTAEKSAAEIAESKRKRKIGKMMLNSMSGVGFSSADLEGEIDIEKAVVETASISNVSAELGEFHPMARSKDDNLMPFNLSDLHSEGRVDEHGQFIQGRLENNAPEDVDPWLQDNVFGCANEEIEKVKRAKDAKDKREAEEAKQKEDDDMSLEVAYAMLGHIEGPGFTLPDVPFLPELTDTPAGVMMRLKGQDMKNKNNNNKMKKTVAPMRLEKKTRDLVNAITDLCSVVFDKMSPEDEDSNLSVYDTTKKSFQSLARKSFPDDSSLSKPPEG
eukprot:GHVH01006920.1.p2 GENE.GHVH01006920.1~~GHVH01006920.1.p2  ORF type:complete len:367 (+),score=89.15 GHVH01006920.1:1404-2504(+)